MFCNIEFIIMSPMAKQDSETTFFQGQFCEALDLHGCGQNEVQ